MDHWVWAEFRVCLVVAFARPLTNVVLRYTSAFSQSLDVQVRMPRLSIANRPRGKESSSNLSPLHLKRFRTCNRSIVAVRYPYLTIAFRIALGATPNALESTHTLDVKPNNSSCGVQAILCPPTESRAAGISLLRRRSCSKAIYFRCCGRFPIDQRRSHKKLGHLAIFRSNELAGSRVRTMWTGLYSGPSPL